METKKKEEAQKPHASNRELCASELKNLSHGQPPVLWKNFARRIRAESQYAAMRYEYKCLGFAFRSSEPFTYELERRCFETAVLCRERVNGRPWLSYWQQAEEGTRLNFNALRRSGASAIHFQYVREMVRALEEFSGKGVLPVLCTDEPELWGACEATAEALRADPLFKGAEALRVSYLYAAVPAPLGGFEAGKVGVLRIAYRKTCVLIVARNWINPVHRSRQKKDLDALSRLAEAHKKRFDRVYAFLVCPKAEWPKVQADKAVVADKIYPHIQPRQAMLHPAYPSGESWSPEQRAEFANWIMRMFKREMEARLKEERLYKRNSQEPSSLEQPSQHRSLNQDAPYIPMYQKGYFNERGEEKGHCQTAYEAYKWEASQRSVCDRPPPALSLEEAAERLAAELRQHALPAPLLGVRLNVTTKAVGYAKIFRSYRYLVFDVPCSSSAWVPLDPVALGDSIDRVAEAWYGRPKTHREGILFHIMAAASMSAAAIKYYRRAKKYRASAKRAAEEIVAALQRLLRRWFKTALSADISGENCFKLAALLINAAARPLSNICLASGEA